MRHLQGFDRLTGATRPRFRSWLLWLTCFLLVGSWHGRADALSAVMTAWSGSDGVFNTISLDGKTVYQSQSTGADSYTGFMYFKRPAGINFSPGAALYMEVDYKDIGGPGSFGAQYSATGNDYQVAGFALDVNVQNTGAYRTAVFRLDDADLHGAQNGGADLRLSQPGPVQLHIVEVRVSDQPTALYAQLTSFLGPYSGPTYAGGTAVDASTMTGKLLCGYQGWFRAPGDDDNTGWQHYIPDWGGAITPAKIAVDYWPEMTELGPAEQHLASGFTHPDKSQATLFSSDSTRTVLRHFQWMEAYGIDGVAVQRFLPGKSPDLPTLRVLSDVRAAANLTGRTFFVEYDMSGTPEAELVPTITRDWHYLVDTLKLGSDSRYLQQGGLPVVGVFGFYEERFSTATANAILDIFKGPGPYQAFVAGAGAWYWNVQPYSDAWKSVIYRMGSWQPWNTGNSGGNPGDVPSTAYWAADKAALAAHGVIYVPQIYPGGSDFNRSKKPWGPSTEDRLSGAFLWSQAAQAVNVGASSVFLGMFDEMDEGTQIFKVSQTPPTEAHFRDYQGLPSDAYLCFTGQATRMLRGEIPYSAVKPDCAAKTQPSIPDPVAPLNGDALTAPDVTYSWTPAVALAGGGTIDHYEIWLDGVVTKASGTSQAIDTANGTHVWRVRAVNSLGNAGGFSVAQTFTVSSSGSAGSSGAGGGATASSGSSGAGGSESGSGGESGVGGGGSSSDKQGKCACTVPGTPSSDAPIRLVPLLSLLAIALRRRRAR
jgi:MYXO-CTERM domain-containing protein